MESNKIAYGRFTTDLQTKYNLNNLCKRLGINSVSDEYHTTVLYSKENVERLLKYNPSLQFPLVCDVIGYELFGENKNCLVLKLAHPDLHNVFNELKALGASYDYPEYTPHLTLTYTFSGELPAKPPKFKVKLTGYKAEESVDDFQPENSEVKLTENKQEEKSTLTRFQEAVSEAKLSQWAAKFRDSGKETDTFNNLGLSHRPAKEAEELIKALAVRAFPNFSQTAVANYQKEQGKNYLIVKPFRSTDGMIASYDIEADSLTLYSIDS